MADNLASANAQGYKSVSATTTNYVTQGSVTGGGALALIAEMEKEQSQQEEGIATDLIANGNTSVFVLRTDEGEDYLATKVKLAQNADGIMIDQLSGLYIVDWQPNVNIGWKYDLGGNLPQAPSLDEMRDDIETINIRDIEAEGGTLAQFSDGTSKAIYPLPIGVVVDPDKIAEGGDSGLDDVEDFVDTADANVTIVSEG